MNEAGYVFRTRLFTSMEVTMKKDLAHMSADELRVLRNCRKKAVRRSLDPEHCICARCSSVGALTYEHLALSFIKYMNLRSELDPTRLKRMIRKWLINTQPSWTLTADDYEALCFTIRCRFTAKSVKTRRENLRKKKQGLLDL